MKIAFLISAYTDPKQLGNMVEALQDDNHWFFIHVDKKVNIEPFVGEVKKYNHVNFVADRLSVNWGGYHQVLYQKELLRSCIEIGVDFDRVFILTAQDYPLWNKQKIHKLLIDNPTKEWIWGANITNMEGRMGQLQRQKVVLYHFFRDINVSNYNLKKMISGPTRIFMKMTPFRKNPYVSVAGKRWDIWYSSGYMCITMQLARYIYKSMTENKELEKYFKTSFVPEELVIPTIVFNSVFVDRCTKKTSGNLIDVSAVTYFNYGKAIQVFDETNYDELMQSGKMFARKFSSTKSARLMEILRDSHIS